MTIGGNVDGGQGTITLDDTLGNNNSIGISGKIGNLANAKQRLKLLSVGNSVSSKDGKYVVLMNLGGGEQSINEIKFAGTSNLLLDGVDDNGIFGIGKLTLNGGNEVNVFMDTHDITLQALDKVNGLSFGTDDKRLGAFTFNDNKILKIGDKVKIYATSLTNATNNHGKIEFLGDGMFDAPILAGRKIDSVTGPGVGKTGVIVGDIALNDNVTGGAGILRFLGAVDATGHNITGNNSATAVLEFAGDVTAAQLRAGGKAVGTLKFSNDTDVNINIAEAIGGNNLEHKIVEFSGKGNITGQNGLKMHNVVGSALKFTTQSATPVLIDLGSVTNSVFAAKVDVTHTGKSGVTHVLQFKVADATTFGQVGAVDKMIELRNTADTAIQTSSADGLRYAKVTNKVNEAGTFTFNLAGGSKVGALGTSPTQALKLLTFTHDGEVIGDTYAKEHAVAAGKKATFGGLVVGTADPASKLNLGAPDAAGVDSTAVFRDGATLDIKITNTKANDGVAIFEGSSFIKKDIGTNAAKIKQVNLNGDATKIHEVNANIYANDIKSANAILKFSDGVNIANPLRTLQGKTEFDSNTLDLGSLKLNISGGVDGKLTLKNDMKVNTKLAVDASENVKGGSIDVDNAAILDVSGLAKIDITVEDTSTNLPSAGQSRSFTFLNAPNVTIGQAKPVNIVKVTGAGSLTKWSGSFDANSNIILTQENNAQEVLAKSLATNAGSIADSANAEIYAQSPSNTNLLNKITDPAKIAEFIKRGTANVVNQVVANLVGNVNDAFSTRLGNLAGSSAIKVASTDSVGVAAGDEDYKSGAWMMPFIGTSTQKARNSSAGYSASTYGASFGFDTKVNEDMTVGVGASIFNSDVKHKDFKSGDKTKLQTYMFSVYGMQQLNNLLFSQAVVSFGSSDINSSENRVVTNTSNAKVTGKYKTTSFGAELFLGSNIVIMDEFVLTPMGGLRYVRNSGGSYKETGDTAQLLNVSKNSDDKFEGVIGAKLSGEKFDMEGVELKPEVHAFVTHDFSNKDAKVTMKLDDVATALNSKVEKTNKTYFNFGFGVDGEQDILEYGVAYDLNLSKKYMGHQGTLKLRVNF